LISLSPGGHEWNKPRLSEGCPFLSFRSIFFKKVLLDAKGNDLKANTLLKKVFQLAKILIHRTLRQAIAEVEEILLSKRSRITLLGREVGHLTQTMMYLV